MKFPNGVVELKNKEKYSFKPYNAEYVKQFYQEKRIILKTLKKSKHLKIEHIGSTAVPGLGGKGIIDIVVEVLKKDFLKSQKILVKHGYLFKPLRRTWFFFKKYYKKRKVHVHLVYKGTNDFSRELAVRDYLIKNKKEMKKYGDIKKKAVKHAGGIGQKYRDYKKPYLDKLEKKALNSKT